MKNVTLTILGKEAQLVANVPIAYLGCRICYVPRRRPSAIFFRVGYAHWDIRCALPKSDDESLGIPQMKIAISAILFYLVSRTKETVVINFSKMTEVSERGSEKQ
mmetsp:Transcript_29215/g.73410  ORF Transcript_29215/g.73410 Transcript_29215/m.73410 type:complete len:105 (-) Transcript_29215:148-462(-)